ncbi:MAG: ABC transporter permease [Thermostichus sp. DG02_5_bins_236]
MSLVHSGDPQVASPLLPESKPVFWNRRRRTILTALGCGLLLVLVLLSPYGLGSEGLSTRLSERNLPPSWIHPFGTDWLGRDMLVRTMHGLSLSLWVGLAAASLSAVMAVVLGSLAASLGGWVDVLITGAVDLFLSLPHLVLLILIAFSLGGGMRGVLAAVALTHWTGLTRLIRAEILQLKSAEYIQLAAKLGHGPLWIARHHFLPHVLPQVIVGLILLFPHTILHEAGLSFIGMGLSPHTPAIGIILSEAMRHLSTGYWWLGVFPGLALLLMVKAFDTLGTNLHGLMDPRTSQE